MKATTKGNLKSRLLTRHKYGTISKSPRQAILKAACIIERRAKGAKKTNSRFQLHLRHKAGASPVFWSKWVDSNGIKVLRRDIERSTFQNFVIARGSLGICGTSNDASKNANWTCSSSHFQKPMNIFTKKKPCYCYLKDHLQKATKFLPRLTR